MSLMSIIFGRVHWAITKKHLYLLFVHPLTMLENVKQEENSLIRVLDQRKIVYLIDSIQIYVHQEYLCLH